MSNTKRMLVYLCVLVYALISINEQQGYTMNNTHTELTNTLLAKHYGLEQYSNDSYTHQPTYSTVERLGGKWTVLDIDNTYLLTGTFEECCEFVTTQEG